MRRDPTQSATPQWSRWILVALLVSGSQTVAAAGPSAVASAADSTATCSVLMPPENARVLGNSWRCRSGFTRSNHDGDAR